MDLKDYFDPVLSEPDYPMGEKDSFGNSLDKYLKGKKFPEWERCDIAVIGVTEYRNMQLPLCSDGAGRARSCLYSLSSAGPGIRIADLGDLKPGKTVEDSFAALRDVVSELIQKKTIPLILGGNMDLTLAIFRAYEINKRTINLTAIDSRPGLSNNHSNEIISRSFLNSIISAKSRYLFNYTNIGYQSYLAGREEIKLLEDLLFDFVRVGMAKDRLKETEPVMRDTDLAVISMSAIRQSDAPAAIFPSPNGFFGEEVCQIGWYAGKSERISGLFITDWYAADDLRNLTAMQAAQIAWYFIEGFCKRKDEYPFNPSRDCTKFIVNITGQGNELVFYKSTRTGRWWMEVPSSKLPGGLMLPCSYEDYQRACNQEVPDRWWQNFKKINN